MTGNCTTDLAAGFMAEVGEAGEVGGQVVGGDQVWGEEFLLLPSRHSAFQGQAPTTSPFLSD